MGNEKDQSAVEEREEEAKNGEPCEHEHVYGDIHMDRDLEELERQAGEHGAAGRHDVERALADKKEGKKDEPEADRDGEGDGP
jgi:hypothetical protein